MQIRIEICVDVLLDVLIYYFINHKFEWIIFVKN